MDKLRRSKTVAWYKNKLSQIFWS